MSEILKEVSVVVLRVPPGLWVDTDHGPMEALGLVLQYRRESSGPGLYNPLEMTVMGAHPDRTPPRDGVLEWTVYPHNAPGWAKRRALEHLPEWARGTVRLSFEVTTIPWKHGEVISIEGFGEDVTQTHRKERPMSTVQYMAKDYIACVTEVPTGHFDVEVKK